MKQNSMPWKFKVDVLKVNGEKIGKGEYDSYEFLDDLTWTEAQTTYRNMGFTLGSKWMKTLVEPGFTITENAYKYIDLYSDLQLYLVETPNGKWQLIDKRKEVQLEAKHIKPVIYTASFIGLSLKHEIGTQQLHLPYFVVTHDNGEKQIYSTWKKQFVTPRISAAGKFDINLDLEVKSPQGGTIDCRYFDKGLMGVYVSAFPVGTPCAYKELQFIDQARLCSV